MIPTIQYSTWLSLFALSLELFVHLPGNEDIRVKSRWSDLSALELGSNTEHKILLIEFYSRTSGENIRSFALLPWQDLYPPGGNEVQMDTKSLLTVNPVCLVFDVHGMADPELNPKINNGMDVLFDALYNEKILSTEQNYTMEPGVQVIRMQEHPFYVQFEFALPGSVNIDEEQLTDRYPMKMINRISIPDRGSIFSTWLKSGEPYLNDAFMQEQDKLLRYIKRAIRKSKRNPGQEEREAALQKTMDRIRDFMQRKDAEADESLYYFNSNLLKKLLWLDHEPLQNIPPANPFADYQPKTGPDKLLDFRPLLSEEFDALPLPRLENLPGLIEIFLKHQEAAAQKPGTFTEGNPLLGAPEKEYMPSDAELLASECGERILKILEGEKPDTISKVLTENNIRIKEITFRRFFITHADVMGSGRFFYVEQMEEIKISLPD